MSFLRPHNTALPGIAVALLLVAAQSVAAMHDLRHESGTAQNRVCTTCVAASQLSSATVDTGTMQPAPDTGTEFHADAISSFDSIHRLVPRQRGPPLHH